MFPLTFRRRQFIVLSLLTLVPLLVTLLVAISASRRSIIMRTEVQLETVADLKTSQIEGWLTQGKDAAQMTVELLLLENAVHGQNFNETMLNRSFRILTDNFSSVESLSFLDPESGVVLCSTRPAEKGKDRSAEPFFQQGRQALYISPVSHIQGETSPIISVSTPVWLESATPDLLGVVVVEMDLGELQAIFNDRTSLNGHTQAYLIDAHGHYVTRPSNANTQSAPETPSSEGIRRVIVGETGSALYTDPTGIPVLGVYRWLPETELGLLIETNRADLSRNIRTSWLIMGLVYLIFAVIALFISWQLANWLVSPLEEITNTAAAIRAGQLDRRVTVTGHDEIGLLGQTFNQMADRLQGYYGDLELQVAQRTAALATANTQLEQEITIRRQTENALRQAKEEAESANQAKSRFLANMNHEFRTPLNIILGHVQIMLRQPDLNPQDQIRLQTMIQSGEHLLALISDVLDLAKIEADQIELQAVHFSLPQLLSTLQRMFVLRANEKELVLRFELTDTLPTYIAADQQKLRQVLINLLHNAIKFTRQGEVALKLIITGTNDPQNTLLHFAVEDTGPGIDPKLHGTIFEPFSQVTKTGQHAQGSGLGLAIAQQYVNLMGGTLQCNSETGSGSVFFFSIPVTVVEPDNINTSPVENTITGLKPGHDPIRILVAEREAVSRKLLTDMLTVTGFDVIEAQNGQAVLQKNQTAQPHLIFLHLNLPDMDGVQVTQKIRAGDNDHKGPVIIALTGDTNAGAMAQFIKAGGQNIIYKPYKMDDLLEEIQTHLPVEYTFSGDSPLLKTITSPIQSVSLEHIPVELKQQLTVVVQQADMTAINNLLPRIRVIDEAAADYIAYLTYNFDYIRILNLIEENK